MIKKIAILLVVLITQVTFAQKSQKVGYIDREYILENVPEYVKAQSKLDAKITKWNVSLNKLKTEIESLKLTLVNEKALLTSDIINEREEDILIKETELQTKQNDYFGTSGDLFMLRKQLVKPVQDQIFNAIQEIAKNKKYDIILDKASNDLVMLYTNPKYDVSELVLQKIVKGRKKKENEKKKSDNEIAREKKKDAVKTKIEERKTKQEKLKERIKKQNEAKAAKRAALKKANIEKRAKKIADAKARREAMKNKGKKKPVSDTKEKEEKSDSSKKETETKKEEVVKEEVVKEESKAMTKAAVKKAKIKKLQAQAQAKRVKRDSLKKVASDKRAKKLADIKERKRKLQENKNN